MQLLRWAALACCLAATAGLRAAAAVRPRLAASSRAVPPRLSEDPPQYGAAPPLLPVPPQASFFERVTAVARAARAAWASPETVSAAILPPSERRVGLGFILSYLWPEADAWRAPARVVASLALLVVAKLFIVGKPHHRSLHTLTPILTHPHFV
jgi:ATP-binding cassette subfamily B protein